MYKFGNFVSNILKFHLNVGFNIPWKNWKNLAQNVGVTIDNIPPPPSWEEVYYLWYETRSTLPPMMQFSTTAFNTVSTAHDESCGRALHVMKADCISGSEVDLV